MKLFARFSITQLLLTIKLFLTNVLFFLVKCCFKQFFIILGGFIIEQECPLDSLRICYAMNHIVSLPGDCHATLAMT